MKLARHLGKDIDVSDWFHSVLGSMAIPISSELMECLDKFNEGQDHAAEDFAALLNTLREGQRSCTSDGPQGHASFSFLRVFLSLPSNWTAPYAPTSS
jgi:hypothetical protein